MTIRDLSGSVVYTRIDPDGGVGVLLLCPAVVGGLVVKHVVSLSSGVRRSAHVLIPHRRSLDSVSATRVDLLRSCRVVECTAGAPSRCKYSSERCSPVSKPFIQ